MCVFETYNRLYVYCLYCAYWNYNNQGRHIFKIPMMKHIVCLMSYLKIKNTMMCVVRRYVADALHRRYVADALHRRYVTDALHRRYVADALHRRYVTDALHRRYVADALHCRYVADARHRRYVADALHRRYVADALHRRYVANARHRRYVADARHRRYVADASHRRYVADARHRRYVADKTFLHTLHSSATTWTHFSLIAKRSAPARSTFSNATPRYLLTEGVFFTKMSTFCTECAWVQFARSYLHSRPPGLGHPLLITSDSLWGGCVAVPTF